MKIAEEIAKEIDRIIRMDDLNVSIEQKKVLVLGEIAVTLAGLLEVRVAELGAPSVQPQRWIPVTETLPEEDKRVLCQMKGGELVISYHHGKYWAYGCKPIAWLSLPEPYKEELYETNRR